MGWVIIQGLFVSSWLPGSNWRLMLLRLFGARIGKGVIIKPKIRVKFPWKLFIGDYSWIGEEVWIDNLAEVYIGDNVCLSQGAYICTGNHNYAKETFDLITKQVRIENGAWICAFSKIAPGITVKKNAVVGFGAVLKEDAEEGMIYLGNPAEPIKSRPLKQ